MRSPRFEIGMLLLPAILMTSCLREDDADSSKVNLTFRFTLEENNEGRTSAGLSSGATVLISLETSNGALVMDQQEVAIQKDADGYVTAPIEVPRGNYHLVDFMVADESGEVVYATPRKGSELSPRIARSLPYNLTIDKEKTFDNSVAVLATRAKTAKSFGYNSFRRGSHSFKLQVFIPKGNKLLRTSAEALIMKGLDTLRTYRLSEKSMNTISFAGDPGEAYTLVVVKDSYARFARDFTTQPTTNKPLKVVLEPALTVVAVPIADQNYFGMQIDPAWGIFDYMVDWGDGTSEMWTSGVTTAVEHRYPQPGQYFISITGHALDSLVLVGNLAGGGEIQRLGLEHIVRLHDFRIEYGQTPKVIDLSHSTFLSEIRIYPRPGDETRLEELIIPNDASIHTLEIGQNINMKPESFNEVVNDLHHQVVNNPRPGTVWYALYFADDIPMVTPSAEALAKLRELKNTYQWSVFPDPDVE